MTKLTSRSKKIERKPCYYIPCSREHLPKVAAKRCLVHNMACALHCSRGARAMSNLSDRVAVMCLRLSQLERRGVGETANQGRASRTTGVRAGEGSVARAEPLVGVKGYVRSRLGLARVPQCAGFSSVMADEAPVFPSEDVRFQPSHCCRASVEDLITRFPSKLSERFEKKMIRSQPRSYAASIATWHRLIVYESIGYFRRSSVNVPPRESTHLFMCNAYLVVRFCFLVGRRWWAPERLCFPSELKAAQPPRPTERQPRAWLPQRISISSASFRSSTR